MILDILKLAGITFIPGLELRASIPFGILKTDFHWFMVFIICVIANILIGILFYFFLDKIVHLFFRFKWFFYIYNKFITRAQTKLKDAVDRYGTLGLSIFIGIPLPGTGAYTGAAGAYVLGFGYKRFIIANVLGVLIAGIIVTAVMLTGAELFSIFVSM